jgi:3-oxoacyl-[acyl-carrier protein] reductase
MSNSPSPTARSQSRKRLGFQATAWYALAVPLPVQSSESGRNALITGAGGGLGGACCAALAARGAHVVVADLDLDSARRVADGLRADGASASAVRLDVTDREDVTALVDETITERGSLDIVVNLAGVMRNQTVTHIVDDDFQLVMDTHAGGVLNTMRAVVPAMRERQYGRIVSMSSIALRGTVAGSAYGAAKGAILGITQSAALELAHHGITVNCLSPGLLSAGMFMTTPPEYQEQARARIPMRRLGEPQEIAACVAFLASAEASYITGQTLTACGGLSLGF